MVRTLLSDEVWKKIKDIVPGKEGDRGRTAADNRWFVEAVLWIGRTGSPWRDLPVEFGRWHTVYMRFARWRRDDVWQRVALAVAGEGEIEHILIDSTIVRAHQHSCGRVKKRFFADLRDRLETKRANTPTTVILELRHNKNQEGGGWPHAIVWPSSVAGKAIACAIAGKRPVMGSVFASSG